MELNKQNRQTVKTGRKRENQTQGKVWFGKRQ